MELCDITIKVNGHISTTLSQRINKDSQTASTWIITNLLRRKRLYVDSVREAMINNMQLQQVN